MKVKVYNNVIYISEYMFFQREQAFTNTFQYLSDVVSSHKTSLLQNKEIDILYKDKVKDEWYCKGSIHFLQEEIMISDGFYLKQDLDSIISFKNKMIEIVSSISNVKEYLAPKQSFCYPNTENQRISVGIELW